MNGVEPDKMVVLYDGVCALCNGMVKFVLKRDKRDKFRFAALQGDGAREVLTSHGEDPNELDTMYVVLSPGAPDERLLKRGRAGLKVLRNCGGLWPLTIVFAILPNFVLNFFYNRVAKTRYKRFGKYDSCPTPAPEHRAKFVA